MTTSIEVKLLRANNSHPDFQHLVRLLDADLNKINQEAQKDYNQHNQLPAIDTVVIAYVNDMPVGCGCFKELSEDCVEVKRMFVDPNHRGKGISSQILMELEKWALSIGHNRMVLETGKLQHEAIMLYTKRGFMPIECYGPYKDLPNSLCFEKVIIANK